MGAGKCFRPLERVPSNFGQNNTEIKKTTRYQDLKNEVKISWKLKSTKIVSVIIGAMEMIKNNFMDTFKKNIPANITIINVNINYYCEYYDPEKSHQNKTLRKRRIHSIVHES